MSLRTVSTIHALKPRPMLFCLSVFALSRRCTCLNCDLWVTYSLLSLSKQIFTCMVGFFRSHSNSLFLASSLPPILPLLLFKDLSRRCYCFFRLLVSRLAILFRPELTIKTPSFFFFFSSSLPKGFFVLSFLICGGIWCINDQPIARFPCTHQLSGGSITPFLSQNCPYCSVSYLELVVPSSVLFLHECCINILL